jgi:hypothetical protein
VATLADVRRICLALPETGEAERDFAFGVRIKGKLKGFVWVWKERVNPKKARVPNPGVMAIRTASVMDREILIKARPKQFFTEPHYEGFPAVLVRLEAITARELKPLIADAWRTQAPKALLDAVAGRAR